MQEEPLTNEPAGQEEEQELEPGWDILDVAQGMQADSAVAPVVALYVPEGHLYCSH